MANDQLFKKGREGRTRRQTEIRKQKPDKWLVVCEGKKTEPNYFKGIIDFMNKRLPKDLQLDVTYAGEGMNTVSLVDRATQLQQVIDKKTGEAKIPYGVTIVIFDKDSFKDDNFNKAIQMCESNGYIACWSNQAVEYWFLLHFMYCDSGMDRKYYQEKLTEQFKKCGLKIKYKKNLERIFEILYTNGDLLQAITYSKRIHSEWLQKNTSPAKSESCTTIYKFFEQIDIRNDSLSLPLVKDIYK